MSVLPIVAGGLVAVLGAGCAFHFYPAHGLKGHEEQLADAKRRAVLWLVAVAACFLATFAAPQATGAILLRSGFGAAMVGAIADWIAVSALFRRIWLVSESDVIARQKDSIGDELARFVHDKFLDAGSLAELIRRHDLGAAVAGWLTQEANTRRLAGFLLKSVTGFLHVIEEDRVQDLLKDATRSLMGQVDLSRSAGQVLESLTADGRHQELLDQLIVKILDACNQRETRDAIAGKIVHWLRTEHRFKQLVLPTEWIGAKGSEIIAGNLGSFLQEVQADRGHPLRAGFDRQVGHLVSRLQTDPVMRLKGEEIKQYLLNDEHLARYAGGLWARLSEWIRNDIESRDSVLHRNLVASAGWLGRRLASDPELRRTLNAQLEAAARTSAPEFAQFLTRHIRDTVHAWDAREMSRQVELVLGARLQKIRFNGTAMGFVIGVLLFVAERAADRWLVG
ncbi:DUF445 domain-containing protein [Ramlibacter henchirensis]|nr:DUF445 family protein [Ramlibacter henchirensis]